MIGYVNNIDMHQKETIVLHHQSQNNQYRNTKHRDRKHHMAHWLSENKRTMKRNSFKANFYI